MKITRREFLISSGMAACGFGLPARGLLAAGEAVPREAMHY